MSKIPLIFKILDLNYITKEEFRLFEKFILQKGLYSLIIKQLSFAASATFNKKKIPKIKHIDEIFLLPLKKHADKFTDDEICELHKINEEWIDLLQKTYPNYIEKAWEKILRELSEKREENSSFAIVYEKNESYITIDYNTLVGTNCFGDVMITDLLGKHIVSTITENNILKLTIDLYNIE